MKRRRPDVASMAAVLADFKIPLADEAACFYVLMRARFQPAAIIAVIDVARELALELRGAVADQLLLS
jgi:hypothetical protein